MTKFKFILFTTIFCCFCIFLNSQSVSAASFYDSVQDGQTDSDGYYIMKASTVDEIQDALKLANQNATDAKPYKIVVKPSNSVYNLDSALILYSNIYLYAQGASFKQPRSVKNNMLRVGNSDDFLGYHYRNIVIDGGVWDQNNNSNTLAKLAQTQNITVRNATFQNSKKGHLMEVAGVCGLTIDHCTFKNQINPSKTSKIYEAIQLEILVKQHLNGYRSQDLPNKDITVTNCSFNNVPRGIGSHTTVLNNPINGVTISNNHFTNIASCAVQLLNVINCTISDNIMENTPRGVTIFGAVYESQDTYLATTLSKEGKTSSATSVKYKKPAANMNIVINNNQIRIKGKDPFASYERSGIFISGYNAKSKYKSSSGDKLPKGNYYVSGVQITNNTVQGNSHGVKLVDVRNTKINNNKLSFTGSMGKVNYYGIVLKSNTKNITLSKNTISKHLNGIYLKGAGAGNISGNTIKNVKKYGISIERSTASKTDKNNVNKTKKNGIHIWDKSTVKTITGNKITSSKARGIYVGGKSKVTTISKNKFKSCKVKIFVNPDSKVKKKQGK